MTRDFWFLIVDAGATYRLVLLAWKDTITQPIRTWLVKPWSWKSGRLRRGPRWWLVELTGCPWCCGLWIGAAVIAATKLWPSGWAYGAAALTLSAVAGLLVERT